MEEWKSIRSGGTCPRSENLCKRARWLWNWNHRDIWPWGDPGWDGWGLNAAILHRNCFSFIPNAMWLGEGWICKNLWKWAGQGWSSLLTSLEHMPACPCIYALYEFDAGWGPGRMWPPDFGLHILQDYESKQVSFLYKLQACICFCFLKSSRERTIPYSIHWEGNLWSRKFENHCPRPLSLKNTTHTGKLKTVTCSVLRNLLNVPSPLMHTCDQCRFRGKEASSAQISPSTPHVPLPSSQPIPSIQIDSHYWQAAEWTHFTVQGEPDQYLSSQYKLHHCVKWTLEFSEWEWGSRLTAMLQISQSL